MTSTIVTVADATGDGNAHQISATPILARWVDIYAQSGATGVRTGDSSISATQGRPIAASSSFLYPVIVEPTTQPMYDLSTIYYRGANGDKITITYAR